MDDLTFEQMMAVVQSGHNQTMEMLDKLIELKAIQSNEVKNEISNDDSGTDAEC